MGKQNGKLGKLKTLHFKLSFSILRFTFFIKTMKNFFYFSIVAFIVMAGALYYVVRDDSSVFESDFSDISFPKTETSGMEIPREIPAGMREYKNETYGFSLFYPEDMIIREIDEGGGARTFIFEDVANNLGFQIFVVPYSQSQVSQERFKKDIPSGVRLGMTDTIIDGAIGATFYSSHFALGETREIWFIHSGYLYEVTTLKPMALWLETIMQSWKFI